jgi:3-oxoacyl-[acyl-carrier protein] reductase
VNLGLEGKVALVTGSYRGTGAGIAEVLAAEGAQVFVHGFEAGQPEPVVERICSAGNDAVPVVGEIRDDEGAEAVAAEVLECAGRVDVLVNNYGVAERGSWLGSSTDDWVDIYQKNVLSGVRLVHHLAPGMRERGWGRIVWLGTVGSVRPAARMPHYYASKAVLPNVCVSLAKELAGTGITVNVVSPGLIATAEVKAQLERQSERGDGGPFAAMLANPSGRMSEIDEVASLVAFVASDRAGTINGANLRIDGGATDCAV